MRARERKREKCLKGEKMKENENLEMSKGFFFMGMKTPKFLRAFFFSFLYEGLG